MRCVNDGNNDNDFSCVHSTVLFDRQVRQLIGDITAVDMRAKSTAYEQQVADAICTNNIYRVIYRVNKRGYVSVKKIDLSCSSGDSDSDTNDESR